MTLLHIIGIVTLAPSNPPLPCLVRAVTEVRCPDGVIDHPEMSATFACLGVHVRQDGDSHYMHVVLEEVRRCEIGIQHLHD